MLILIVDDHPLYRDALVRLLPQVFPAAHVHQASDCASALARLRQGPAADLVLLDLDLPGMDGRAGLACLREAFPQTRVVIVSATEQREAVARCLQGGAAGFIPKSAPTEVLAAALTLVRDGGVYLPSLLLEPASGPPGAMLRAETADRVDTSGSGSGERLTPRETEVLTLLCAGHGNKAIGNQLGMSEATVRTHLTSVFRRLGVVNRTQAAREARRRRLVPDDL
ncbi:MAG: response regulator transcription factor [Burkholderiales bacterium]